MAAQNKMGASVGIAATLYFRYRIDISGLPVTGVCTTGEPFEYPVRDARQAA